MINQQAFFLQDYIVKGSSFYYSTLHLSKPEKQAVMTLYALQKSLMTIIYDCSEPNIAITKLKWWQQELEAMWDGKGSHPITQALYPIVQQYQLPKQLFASITTHLESGFNTLFFPSFAELKHFYQNTLGSFIKLMALVLAPNNKHQNIDKLGISLGLIYHTRELRKDINKGLLFFGQEDLAKHQVNEKKLFAQKITPEIVSLLSDYSQRAKKIADETIADFSKSEKKALRSLLILTKLQLRLVDEIKKDGFNVFTHYTSLTPLRKLWLSWKKAI